MQGLLDRFGHEFQKLLEEFRLPLENPILTFSLLLLIILLSPILLRKLKVPALIGLIISGIIIGPKGFGVISKSNLTEGYVYMFKTFGLLYIMFMAGLELNMQDFRRYRNKSITFGALTFFVPLLLGYPICRYVIGLNEIGSLLTASMFATHTLVAYPILSKYGITKLDSVAIAIGGTILTDTAVLIILAVISSSEGGHINTNTLIHLGVTLTIFSLIMFGIIPRISRWFFSKLESEKSSHYVYVLAILFFASFLAEAAGIEAIIGAFVAGLVLNQLIPHSSALMNRIEFIGNSLFIPFFLISIGMVVDPKVLISDPWAWAIAGILTSFAIFSKFFAALITQWIFKMKRSERQIIFGLSTAHAAATLAVINVGYNMHIIDENVVNGTVILILVTSMTASFVTENAGKKILIEQVKNEPVEQLALRNQHVLVAANELRGNELLLDFSILITNRKVINPLSVVSVMENDEDAERNIRRARKHMDDFISHYSGGEISVQTMATIDHNMSSGIARVSKELAADIILINDHSEKNLLKRLVGDDKDHLLDVCDKSIFFCHFDRKFASFKKIYLSCVPLCEVETSFTQWLDRLNRISRELKLNIDIVSTKETFSKVKEYFELKESGAVLAHTEIQSHDELLKHEPKNPDHSLVFMIMARKGSISAGSGLDGLSSKMEKMVDQFDRVIVYPAQQTSDTVFGTYDDMNSGPLTVGVETLQRLGKEVGGIFKKSDSEN